MTTYSTEKINAVDTAPSSIADADYVLSSDESAVVGNTYKRTWLDVKNYVLSGVVSGVSSVFGRTGDVVADGGDYTATQVTNTPAGNISAVTVQAAINELDTEKLGIASHTALSVVGRSANSVGDIADIALSNGQFLGVRSSVLGGFAPLASEIVNTPSGNIAATDVQAALNELDSEKAGLALNNVFTTSQTIENATGNISLTTLSDGFLAQNIITSYLAAATGSTLIFRHARGTKSVPAALINGDQCGGFTWSGHTGSGFTNIASIRNDIQAATPGPTDMENTISFRMCAAGSATIQLTFQIGYSLGILYQNVTVLDNNRIWRNRVYTVATLPAAGTAGRRTFVSDANAPVFGAAVAGGGAVNVPVYDTGAAWFVG